MSLTIEEKRNLRHSGLVYMALKQINGQLTRTCSI